MGQLRRHSSLSEESTVFLLSVDANDTITVTGESTTEVEDIETRGTAYLALSAVKRGAMAPERGRETIDAMVDAGWYVAPDLYTTLVRKLESFE